MHDRPGWSERCCCHLAQDEVFVILETTVVDREYWYLILTGNKVGWLMYIPEWLDKLEVKDK
jgi:hypothetical protein